MTRVFPRRYVTAADVGKIIRLQPTQAQLGYHNGDRLFTLDALSKLREEHKDTGGKDRRAEPNFEIDWRVTPDDVGMGIAARSAEIPASTLQAVNPIYILFLGLLFTMLWTLLAGRGWEPSTPVKFALGLLQLGLGMGVFWYGTSTPDAGHGRPFLLFGLPPAHNRRALPFARRTFDDYEAFAGTTCEHRHGGWFLATGFAEYCASIIAQFTKVGDSGGAEGTIPIPKETVHVYGSVFLRWPSRRSLPR